jgi:hypothetical protein
VWLGGARELPYEAQGTACFFLSFFLSFFLFWPERIEIYQESSGGIAAKISHANLARVESCIRETALYFLG